MRIIKTSLAVGILLVSLSAAYYLGVALPQLQKRRLVAQTKSMAWEQERKCYKAAEAAFKDSSWFEANVSSGFDNHFNQKLNKCFMLVRANTSSGSGMFFYQTLIDVNGGTWSSLGEYGKQIPFGVTDYNVKPVICHMLDKYCHTDEEFDALVKLYMEQ